MTTAVPSFNQSPRRIVVKGGEYLTRLEEYAATEAITPGMLVQMDTANAEQVKKHVTDGATAEAMFATEDVYQGKSIDDAYAIGANVFVALCGKGVEVLAWLKAGENVLDGDLLASAGGGLLEKADSTDYVVAVARQALNLSASGAVDTRIVARVL